MMELLDNIHICCNNCGWINEIDKGMIDFDSYTTNHGDNCMGEEIEYSYDDDFTCENCDSIISFRLYGSEYPIGGFNYEDSVVDGGYFIEEPHMGIVYYHDEFDTSYTYPVLSDIETKISNIAYDKEQIYSLTSREFEKVIERLFQDNGYETVLTPQSRDGGKDIIATIHTMGGPIVMYVECKLYGRNKSVDVNIVRSLFGVQTSDKINKSILVTTGHVTNEAHKYAEAQKTLISIVEIDEIQSMLQKSANKYCNRINNRN